MFVGTERTRVLIDAGLSRREITKRLAAIGESVDTLDAILVTHEHSDHTCGLVSMARKLKIPIFLTRHTAPTIDWATCEPRLEKFQAGCGFSIGDFDVTSFTIPHDAIDPVGYLLRANGIKIGVVTDLGYVPDSIKVHLRCADLLLLESNHDLGMLKDGPYPWSIKQRVMSRRGHLSNEVVADFIREDLDGTVSTLILGHLSEHNNHPELVRQAAAKALDCRALFTKLVISEPGTQSEVFVY
ncbi:MAG TPA: MBL fold metallo-hydrolase [Bryobacteraceae bacterium]|nr:MBL fold metallo-hydrolase [Bryobacteraceae bacterium]